MTTTGFAAEGERHQPGRRVVGLGRPDHGAAHLGVPGRVAGVAAPETRVLDLLQGGAGQTLRVPALNTLT